ncbi:MAG: MFS transporter [Coriobacteriales bacterium]|jgi:Na+/melibiose symporter-like transporter
MGEENANVAEEQEVQVPAQSNYKPLSRALRIFYGVGDFGFNLMSSVETYYFIFFLTNCAMFDPATAGVIGAIGSTIDAILGWMYGGFLNAIKPMRWGRYRSWLLWMPWIVPIFFMLEYTVLSDNTAVAAALITIFYVLAHLTWDFPYVSNVTMVAIAGKTPEDRAHLSATRGMWSNASKIVFSYLFPAVASVGAMAFGETGQYAFAALVFGICMAALYNVHFVMFKGYEKEYTKEELKNWKRIKKTDKTSNGFGDMMRALFKNSHLIFLVLADISKWVFNFAVAGMAMYYFTYVLQDPNMMPMYILISNILCVVGAYLSSPMIKVTKSSRNNCIVAFFSMAVLMIIARFVPYNGWAVVILLSVAQLGYGIIYSSIVALYGDCVVYSEWKTGKNSAGWISGLQLLPLKVGFIARSIIVPAILGAAGFVAGMEASATTPALQEGILNGFMIMPACLLIISGLLLLFGFRLTNDKLKQYQAEIDARDAAREAANQEAAPQEA